MITKAELLADVPTPKCAFGKEQTYEDYIARAKYERECERACRTQKDPYFNISADSHAYVAREYERVAPSRPRADGTINHNPDVLIADECEGDSKYRRAADMVSSSACLLRGALATRMRTLPKPKRHC